MVQTGGMGLGLSLGCSRVEVEGLGSAFRGWELGSWVRDYLLILLDLS